MKERVKCHGCFKYFWRKKIEKNKEETIGDILCTTCKNKIRHDIHMRNKDGIKILTDEMTKNIMKTELDKLVKLETINPDLIKRMRERRKYGTKRNGESVTD